MAPPQKPQCITKNRDEHGHNPHFVMQFYVVSFSVGEVLCLSKKLERNLAFCSPLYGNYQCALSSQTEVYEVVTVGTLIVWCSLKCHSRQALRSFFVHFHSIILNDCLLFLGKCSSSLCQSLNQDAILSILSRYAWPQTLSQLLSERHERMSSEPGRPRCWVECLHR